MAKKMSLRKHLVLSFVASSMLYNQAIALPQGGNFVQGGGTINSSGGNMNIHGNGNNQNHVINWGGGFNIGKNESVDFTGQGHHKFLNLDYSQNSSKIYGKLNGNGHDIFLVNPNGTVIGNGAVINTGKFGVSTSAMSEAQIKEFHSTGKFSPVFSPAQKGTITIQGDAILNVNNLQLVGNKIVLKDSININLKDSKTNQIGSFDAYAQSIDLLGGHISGANTINLKTTPNGTQNSVLDGEIEIGKDLTITDLSKMDLSTKILYFQNANLDLKNATLNANADQINLNQATLTAQNITFNATNKIKSLGSNLSATDMTLRGTKALEFSNSSFTATNLALLQSNYIDLDNTSLTASTLKLQADGENSLIDITDSTLTANQSLDITADQIKFNKGTTKEGITTSGKGSTLISKGTANIKANDKIAFEDTQLQISKANIEATNQITFKNSGVNANEVENKGELTLKSESGIVSIENSDFKLNEFTLEANQAELKNTENGSKNHSIDADTLTFKLKDKLIAQNYNFEVSNLDWNAANYIHLNGSKFNLTGANAKATFTAKETKIQGATFTNTNSATLEFKGSNTDSIIEVDGNTNIENISTVKFNANRINIKNGNISATSNLELISDYLDITGGTLTSNGTSNDALKLEGKNYLGISNANINASSGTLTLLTQNLIELKNNAKLNAKNIEFKESDGTNGKDTQINIENGATITANTNGEGTLKILLDRINVKGGTLSAKDLNLEGKQIAITGGEFKGTIITLKGDDFIKVEGDTVKIGTETTENLNLESGNLIEVKSGSLTAKAIKMTAQDNNPSDDKNRGTIDLLGGTITAKASDIVLVGRDINFGGANLSATSGRIDADASNLISVSGSGSITGNIELDADKEIRINGNLGDESSNITLNTEGQFNVTGGTLKAKDFGVSAGAIDFKNANLKAGNIKFEATNKILISGDTTKIEGSRLILNSASLIDISGGSLISSSTITFNNNETLNNDSKTQEIKISGGTIKASGDLSANADGIHISGGEIKADGKNINFKASNDISISGENTKIDAANITLEGLGVNGGIKIDAGTITATALLKLLANNKITISGGNLSGASVDIAANGNVENEILKGGLVELKGGTIKATGSDEETFKIAGNDIKLQGSTLETSKNLSLNAKNLLEISSGELKVENGKLILNGDKEVKISGATFTTSKDNTTLEVKSSGKVTYNQASKTLQVNGLTINSGEIDIQGGTIDAKGEVKFTSNTNITFKNATLTTESGITFKADKGIIVGGKDKDASKTTLTAQGITFESKNISIANSTLDAKDGELKLTAKAVNNGDGETYKEGGIIEISDSSELKGKNITAEGYDITIQGADTKLTASEKLDLKASNILTLKDSTNISAKEANLQAIAKLYIDGATLSMQGNLSLLSANLIELNNANLSASGNISFEKTNPSQELINGKEENSKLGVVATIKGGSIITTNGGDISFAVDKVDIKDQAKFTASGKFSSNGAQFYMNGGTINATGMVDIDAQNYISLSNGADISGKTLDFLGNNVIDITGTKLTATGGGITITALKQVNITGDNNNFTTKKGGDDSADTDITIQSPNTKVDNPNTDIDGDGSLNVGGSESLVYNKLDGSKFTGSKNITLIGTNYLGIFNSTVQGLNVNFISNNFIEVQNSTITSINGGNISFSAKNDEGKETKISIVNSSITSAGNISFETTYLIIKGKQTGLEGSPDGNDKETTIKADGDITTTGIKEIFIENANLSAGGKMELGGSLLLRITDSILNANSLALSSANWIDIAGGKLTSTGGDITLSAGNGTGNAKVIDITNGAELNAKTNITFNAEQINISKDEITHKDSEGNIINGGTSTAGSKDPTFTAGNDINFNATNLIRISGGTFNANNITLKGINGVEFKGDTTSITANGALKFLSDNVINIENGTIDAGSVQFGATNGDTSKLAINLIGGSITSDGVIDLDAHTVNITNATLTGASIDFAVAAMLLNGTGSLNVGGELKINATDNIQIKAGSLIGGTLSLISGNLIDISGGALTSTTGDIILNATNKLAISGGASLDSNQDIILDASVISIDNAKIKGASLDATADNLKLQNITNSDTEKNFDISGAVSLTGKKYLEITGSTLSFTSLSLASNNLIKIANSNLSTTNGAFDIKATDANTGDTYGTAIEVTDSVLKSSNALNLKADKIDLKGATTELNAQNAIDLTAKQILAENIKQIKSTAGDISLNASNYLKITGSETVRTLIEGLNINIMANNLVEITKADLTASAGNIDITASDTAPDDDKGTKIVLNDAKLDANSNSTNDGATGNINIQGFDQINVEGGSVLDAAYNVLLNANKKIVVSGGSSLKALKDLTLNAKETGISIKDANTKLDAESVNLKGGSIVLENGKIYADNSINFSKADGASEVYVKIDNGELKTGANNDGKAGSIKFGDSTNLVSKIEFNGGTINTADLDAYARQIAIANGVNITASMLDLSASELLKISGGTITTGTANLIGSNIIEVSGGTINVSNALTMKNATGADNVLINIKGGNINAENANLDLDAKFIDFANATIKAKNLDATAQVINTTNGANFTIGEKLSFTGSNYIDITGGSFSAKNIDFISNNVISIANATLTANDGNINIKATKGENQATSTKVDITDSTLTATGSDDNGKLNIGADTINISGSNTKLSGANGVSIDANFNLALSDLTQEALKGNITLKAADSLKITNSVLELTSLTLLSNNYISISDSNLKATNGDITIKGITNDNSLQALDISNSIINASQDLNFNANKIYASGANTNGYTTQFISGRNLNFIATSLILDSVKLTTTGNFVLSGSNVVQIAGADIDSRGVLNKINSNNLIDISTSNITLNSGTLQINATDTENNDNLDTKVNIVDTNIDVNKLSNGSYGHIEIGADQINVKESTLNADNKVQLVANAKLVLDAVTSNAGANMIFKGLSGGVSIINGSSLASTGAMEIASDYYIEVIGGSLKSDTSISFYDTKNQNTALVLDGVTIAGNSEGKKPNLTFGNDSTKITGGSINAKNIDTQYTARFELLNGASITADILNLTATNYLNIASGTSLVASGAITLTAANMAALAGNIRGANITVDGKTTGTIDISGALQSTGGALEISGADIFIKNGANLTSSADLKLDAENQVVIGEEKADPKTAPKLTATNAMSIDGKNQVLMHSGALNAGSLAFISQNLIELKSGSVTATNGDITFTASGDSKDQPGQKTGTIKLDNVEITANEHKVTFTGEQLNTNSATVSAKEITADMENKLIANGGSFKAETIKLDGKNAVNLASGFKLENTKDIDLISEGKLSLNGIALSADTIDLKSNQINITGGSLTATNALNIDATKGSGNTGGKITVSGGTTFKGNTVDFKARNDISIANGKSTITATNGVQMLAGNWISLDGVTISGTSFKIAGISESDALNLAELKNVTANDKFTTIDLAAQSIDLQSSDLKASGKITASASNGTLKINNTKLESTGSDIALSGDKHLQVDGTSVIKGISLSFTSKNWIELKAGTITATAGNITLTANGEENGQKTGTIDFSGANLNAQNNAQETSETAGSITAKGEQVNITNGTINADANFLVDAENITKMTGGTLNVKNQLTLDGKNRVEVTGGTLGTDINDLVFLTERHIKLGIGFTTENLTLEGEQITLGNKTGEGEAITIKADNLILKALKDSGVDKTGGIVELLNATLNISKELDIKARNNIKFEGSTINANTAAVSLLAQNNNISITGGSIKAQSLVMQAKNLIDLSNTSVNVSGNDALYIGGIKAENGQDTTAGQVDITNSKIEAQNGITINASNKINISGSSSHHLKANNGKLSLNGGEQIYISGIALSGTGIDLIAKGTVGRIDLSGAGLDANAQAISLQANEGININRGYIRNNNSLDFDAKDIEIIGGNTGSSIQSTGKIDLNAQNQLILNNAKLSTSDTIALNGANQILVKGSSTNISAHALSFISQNLIDLQAGNIKANNGDITFTASNGKTGEAARGTIKFGGANITATGTGENQGDIKANAEQVEITGGTITAENFHAKGNNQVKVTGGKLDISQQLIFEGTEKVSVTGNVDLGTQINDLVFLSKKYIELGITHDNGIEVANLTLRAQQIGLNGGKFNISGNFLLDAGDKYDWTNAPSDDLKGKQEITGNQGVVKITNGAQINAGNFQVWGKNWIYADGSSTITANTVKFDSDNLIELKGANINAKTLDFDAAKAIVIGGGSNIKGKDDTGLNIDFKSQSILLGYTLDKEKGEGSNAWEKFTAKQDGDNVTTIIKAGEIKLNGDSNNNGLIQFGGNLDLDATSLTTSLVKDILVEGKANLNAATLKFLASNLIKITGGTLGGNTITFNDDQSGDVEISGGTINPSNNFTLNAEDIKISGGTIDTKELDFNAANVIEISGDLVQNGDTTDSTTNINAENADFTAGNQITISGGDITGNTLNFAATGGKIVFEGYGLIDASNTLSANAKQIDISDYATVRAINTLDLIATNLINISGGYLGIYNKAQDDGSYLNNDTINLKAQKVAISNGYIDGAKLNIIASKLFEMSGGTIASRDIIIKGSDGSKANTTGTVANITGGYLGYKTTSLSIDMDKISISGTDANDQVGASGNVDLNAKQIFISGGGMVTGENVTIKGSEKIDISGATFLGSGTGTLKLLSDNLINISGGSFQMNTLIDGLTKQNAESSLTELIISGGEFGLLNSTLNANAKNINFAGTVKFENDATFNASNYLKFTNATINADTSTALAFNATNSILATNSTFNGEGSSAITLQTTGDNGYIGLKEGTKISGFDTKVSLNSSKGLELENATITTKNLSLKSSDDMSIASSTLTTSNTLDIEATKDLSVKDSTININGGVGSNDNKIKAESIAFDGTQLTIDKAPEGPSKLDIVATNTFKSLNSQIFLRNGSTLNANAKGIIIEGVKNGASAILGGGSSLNLTATEGMDLKNATFKHQNTSGTANNGFTFEANKINVDTVKFERGTSGATVANVYFKTTGDNGVINFNGISVDAVTDFDAQAQNIALSGTNSFAKEASFRAQNLLSITGTLTAKDLNLLSYKELTANGATFNLSGTSQFMADFQRYTNSSFTSQAGQKANITFRNQSGGNSAQSKIEFLTGTNFKDLGTISAEARGILVKTGTGENQGFISGIDKLDFRASNELKVEGSTLNANTVELDGAYLSISNASKIAGNTVLLNTKDYSGDYLKIDNSTITATNSLTLGADNETDSVIDILNGSTITSSKSANIYADAINLKNSLLALNGSASIKALSKFLASNDTAKTSIKFNGNLTIDGGKEIEFNKANIEKSGTTAANLYLRTTAAGAADGNTNGRIKIIGSTFGGDAGKNPLDKFHIYNQEGTGSGANDLYIENSDIYAKDMIFKLANRIEIKNGSDLGLKTIAGTRLQTNSKDFILDNANLNVVNIDLALSNVAEFKNGAKVDTNYFKVSGKQATFDNATLTVSGADANTDTGGIFTEQILFKNSVFTLNSGKFAFGNASSKYVKFEDNKNNGKGLWVNGSAGGSLTFEGQKIDFTNSRLSTNNATQNINFNSKGDINFNNANFYANGGTTNYYIGSRDNSTLNINFANTTFAENGGSGTVANIDIMAKTSNSSGGKVSLSGLKMTNELDELKVNANWIDIANGADIKAGTIDFSTPGKLMMTGGTITANTFTTASGAGTGIMYFRGGKLNANTITLDGKEVQIMDASQNKGTEIHNKAGNGNVAKVTINTKGFVNASNIYANEIYAESGWISMNITDLVNRGSGPKMSGEANSYLNIATNEKATDNAKEWHDFVTWFNDGKFGVHTYKEYRLLNDIDFSGANIGVKTGLGSQNYGLIEKFTNQTFNGNGKKLTNFTIGTSNNRYQGGGTGNAYAGLILEANNATFKNVVIEDAQMYVGGSTIRYAGLLAGNISSNAIFNNIKFQNGGQGIVVDADLRAGNTVYVGGVVGLTTNGSTFTNVDIEKITVTGKHNSQAIYVGGVVGQIQGGSTISHIYMGAADVSATAGGNKRAYSAGFAGTMRGKVVVDNIAMNNIKVWATGANWSMSSGFTSKEYSSNATESQQMALDLTLNDIYIYTHTSNVSGGNKQINSYFVGAFSQEDQLKMFSSDKSVHLYMWGRWDYDQDGLDWTFFQNNGQNIIGKYYQNTNGTKNWENAVIAKFGKLGFYNPNIQGPDNPSGVIDIANETSNISWNNSYKVGNAKGDVTNAPTGNELEDSIYTEAGKITNESTAGNVGDIIISDGGKYTEANPVDDINHDYNAGNIGDTSSTANDGLGSINVGPIDDLDNSVKDTEIDNITDNNTNVDDITGDEIGDLNDEIDNTFKGDITTTPKDEIGNIANADDTVVDQITGDSVDKITGDSDYNTGVGGDIETDEVDTSKPEYQPGQGSEDTSTGKDEDGRPNSDDITDINIPDVGNGSDVTTGGTNDIVNTNPDLGGGDNGFGEPEVTVPDFDPENPFGNGDITDITPDPIIPEIDIPTDPVTPPDPADPIWSIGSGDVTAGNKGDESGLGGAGKNESNEIVISEGKPSEVGGAESTDKDGYTDINNEKPSNEITITGNDDISKDNSWTGKVVEDTTYTFTANSVDEKGDVILGAGDFDSAILDGILGEIKDKFLTLNIEDLDKALKLIDEGKYTELGKLLGLNESEANDFAQGIDFLKAFYGEAGAGSLLAGLGDEKLSKFDSDVKNLKDVAQGVKDDSFGNKGEDGKYTGGILGDFNEFLANLDEFNKLNGELDKFIQDLKDGKYGQAGSVGYENAYTKYESLRSQVLELKGKLDSAAGSIKEAIAKVLTDSNEHFKIIDKNNVLDTNSLSVQEYEKEQGRNNRPNSRLFAEDQSDENENDTDNARGGKIDEAAGKQKARLCIVSDNAKTMNPCLAMGD